MKACKEAGLSRYILQEEFACHATYRDLAQALNTLEPSSNTTQPCDLWYCPTDENIASLQTSSAFYWKFIKFFFFSFFTPAPL